MAKRVAIVGAGMSGLLACKYAVAAGFTPVVFEAEDQVGGLWNHTMETTRLQAAKQFFRFSDLPWPSSDEQLFPPASHVIGYLKSYADRFELLPYIKFNSKVTSVDYDGESDEEMAAWELWGGNGKAFGSKGKWKLQVLDTKSRSAEEYESEFLILCIGRYSGLPNIPEFPEGSGPEVFSGEVLHSWNYSSMDNAAAAELIKGKRVIVIGSSKSAVDVAFECAIANGNRNPCRMIIRSVPWMLPDLTAWGISLGTLFFNRLSEILLQKPGEGLLHSVFTALLAPMRWGVSKFVESYLRWKLPLKKYSMIPEEPFVQYATSCKILFLPQNFYDKVEEGSIIFKKSHNFRFCKEGLILEGEDKPLIADVVIFATGYKGDEKLRNMFSRPSFRDAILGQTPSSVIPLYRHLVHPRIPQLAVVGYSESLANIYTFEMKCRWLAFFLDNAFALPKIKEMERENEEWGKYLKEYTVKDEYNRACVAGVHIWYNDQICKDIGCEPTRKKGFLKNLLEPYGATDYNGIAPKSEAS